MGCEDGSGEIELDEFLQMMAPKVLCAACSKLLQMRAEDTGAVEYHPEGGDLISSEVLYIEQVCRHELICMKLQEISILPCLRRFPSSQTRSPSLKERLQEYSEERGH